MILSETVFFHGSEMGRILEDLDAGRVWFKPVEAINDLPAGSGVTQARHEATYSTTIGTERNKVMQDINISIIFISLRSPLLYAPATRSPQWRVRLLPIARTR